MKDLAILKNRHLTALLPFILGTILTVLFILEVLVVDSLKRNSLLPSPFYNSKTQNFPILKAKFNPKISAKGAVIMDAASKAVLFSRNPYVRFSSASTTKIMTAITALEYFNLKDVLTVKTQIREGAVIGLKEGEQMSFENLLYGMLLPSGNDAALTIAQNYPNGEKNFVKKMNENAEKFNLFNTHFQDSSGLTDEKDYTTPADLARLASIAIKNREFAKIVSTKSKIITDITGNNVYSVSSLNKLLGYQGVNGVKTGYTEEAGQVLVISKEEKGHTIIIVVMQSLDRFYDTQVLLSLVSGNITYLSIRP